MVDLIILIFTSILNFFLGILVFVRNRKNIVNTIFLGFIISVLVWILSNYLVDKSYTYNSAFFWTKMTFIGSYFIPAFLLFFTIVFPLRREIKKLNRFLIFVPALTFTLLMLSNLIVKGVEDINIHPIVPIFGSFYYLFVLYFLIYIILSFIYLIKSYKYSIGIQKIQLRYLFFGLLISVFFGITTNLLLPLLGNSRFSNYGSYATIFFIVFTVYAIIRHRLLDIRLIILRTITYSLVVLLISAAVVGLTLLLPQALGIDTTTKTIIAIAVSIFIVLVLDPLKKGIAQATDKIFFKAKVDFQKLLADLGEIINREIDLDVLLYSLSHKLEKELKIKNASIYIAGVAGGAFFKRKGRVDKKGHKIEEGEMGLAEMDGEELASRLAHNNPLIKYMNQERRVIVLEGLERKIEDTQEEKVRKVLEDSKAQLDKLDAAVVAPVVVGHNLNAVMVLGPKLSGDPFGSEDINLLELIGPQLASALDKSRLYDEVKQFSERLKKEIAIATEDLRATNVQLQERNRFLSAMQKVTSLITRTLDFQKVTQSIVNSISGELGYLGGILLFLGQDKHKLFPEAVTQTKMTAEVLKFLPKPINEYWGDYRKDNTRSIKAMKTGKVQIGDKFAPFISPPVPEELCHKIQEIMGIKTVIAVPIFSENEVVGAIDFILNKDPGELKETDLSMMKALANQTGIVARNIELYRQLTESNKELGEANRHLKQLDQAKSEFVSIASHQLRTPMAGIMGYLSMILQGDFGKVPGQLKKILDSLLDESQRMIRLINVFLNVSRIEAGRLTLGKQETQIEEIIEKSVGVVKKMASDKKLVLEFKKPAKPMPKIMMDRDKIGDVVTNLIDNAIKYTDAGKITVSVNKEDNRLRISIQDTGIGIEPQEAKDLFNKFVRGYGIAQIHPDGSGLGLYVARRVTEAHGGRIWVESAGKGKGSNFQFTLPLK